MRMLALREVAEDPVKMMATTAFLNIDEARAALERSLSSATAEDRAVAYGLLIDCTRRSRSADDLVRTLIVLRRLRNEQDPVRLAAVTSLARVPAHLFNEACLPDLLGIVDAVGSARDSSHARSGSFADSCLRCSISSPWVGRRAASTRFCRRSTSSPARRAPQPSGRISGSLPAATVFVVHIISAPVTDTYGRALRIFAGRREGRAGSLMGYVLASAYEVNVYVST